MSDVRSQMSVKTDIRTLSAVICGSPAVSPLPLLVGIRFQVCFTPLIGVLFTFPSRYYSLSVMHEYLGLEGGPPMFRQDFSCPALLKDLKIFTRTGLSPTLARLSRQFRLSSSSHWPGPRSLATTNGVSPPAKGWQTMLMSFPPGTEMFQFPGFASLPYEFR